MKAPLNSAARSDPLYSFEKIFQAVTEERPLGLSIVSSSTVEVFLPLEKINLIRQILSNTGYLVEHPPDQISATDVKRRAASYNRAFCQPLRRAILQGFSPELQLQVLQTAELSIPKIPNHRQKIIQKAITLDRDWVREATATLIEGHDV